MSNLPSEPGREEFIRWVHEVLSQLYDVFSLHRHPLTNLLASPEMDTLQRSRYLRELLLNAIQQLRPARDVPASSSAWRYTQILELRYIEGMSPDDIMKELSLSRSTYFREQGRMLEAISAIMWDHWQRIRASRSILEMPGDWGTTPDSTNHTEPQKAIGQHESIAQEEMERLSARATWEVIDPELILKNVRPVVELLAEKKGVKLRYNLGRSYPAIRADRVLLRQAILTAITSAIHIAQDGEVVVKLLVGTDLVTVAISMTEQAIPENTTGIPQSDQPGIEICKQIMTTLGGELTMPVSSTGSWEVMLAWPVLSPKILLVIDDNNEFIDLYQRYLAGYHWIVQGMTDPDGVNQAIAKRPPDAILLDIMMPKLDGWEILTFLRANPRTRHTPVIICSVIYEPDLAQVLGATGYLTKPVSQSELLNALSPFL